MNGARGDADQPGPGTGGGLGGQARRAGHTQIAADDQDMTELALVGATRATGQQHRQILTGVAPAGRVDRRIDIGRYAQSGEAQSPATGRPLTGEQALLEADEGQGGRCLDRRTQNRAGVGVQAGGNVERQNRGGMRVHGVDGFAPVSFNVPLQSRAKNGVHQEIGIIQTSDGIGLDRNAGGEGVAPGGLRVAAQGLRIGERQHARAQSSLASQPGHHVAVTAVVAAAADHHDPPDFGPALAQQVEGGFAGPIHQGIAGDTPILDGEAVQLPHLGGAVQFDGQFAHDDDSPEPQ